jgi:hypothetical protein
VESIYAGGFANSTGQVQVVYYSSFFFACPKKNEAKRKGTLLF